MILHLGEDVSVRLEDVIGIFDLENTTLSKSTRQFLSDAEKGGRVVCVTSELPKTFVVCMGQDKGETVYLSQMAAATLKKRAAAFGG